MEKNTVTQILILDSAPVSAERLINLLRKSGRSVSATKAPSMAELPTLLSQQQWDLLLLMLEPGASIADEVAAFLTSDEKDIPALAVISQREGIDHLGLLACGIRDILLLSNPDDFLQQTHVLRSVERELDGLQERRERRRAQAALRDLEQRYRLLLASTADAISYLHDGVHVYANAAYMSLFGYTSAEEMISVPLLDLVAEEDIEKVRQFLRSQVEMDSHSCAFEALRKDGSGFHAEMDGAVVPYEGERALQVLVRPATGNNALKNTIRQIHNRDLLTGLLNRASFIKQMDHAIGDAVYEQKSATLLLLQLRHLDEVTLVIGKAATNLLLADIGSLLQQLLPEDVICGRVGASDFGVLIPQTNERDDSWVDQLVLSFNEGLRPLLPPTLQLNAVGGVAVISEEASDGEVVIARARANAAAREHNLGVKGLQSVHIRPDAVLTQLREALASGSFILVFQPVVSLKADGVEHFEIRIRMRSASGGDDKLLYPLDFLEIANQHGLGEEIDRWVISQTLELLQQRQNPRLLFTVNLTPNSIMSPTFLPWVVARLHETRQAASQLILQVSELDIVSNPEKVQQFSRNLEELDIRMSVTHFGCSLDPFQHLETVRTHYVKLDKALLQGLAVDTQQQKKLRTTVRGLQKLGLRVIAPMIDHIELLPHLWQAGINMVQGNCLQEPSDSMNFSFTQDEEITLRSYP